MTTQPEIKQYRRKVSDERVEKAAKEIRKVMFFNNRENPNKSINISVKDIICYIDSVFINCTELARAALEADAEVIEAQPYDKIKGYMLLDYGGSVCDIEENEQFQQEWEEIK